MPTEAQAMQSLCIGPEQCGVFRDGVRYCIGHDCTMAWRWFGQEDAREIVRGETRLHQKDTELSGKILCGHDEVRDRRLVDQIKNNWRPPPPDKEHKWQLRDKRVVNLYRICSSFSIVAEFERDKLPSERSGYCGLAGRP